MDPDPSDPVHRRLAERAANQLTCPHCGHTGFAVEWVFGAPVVICKGCGLTGISKGEA